MTTFVTQRTGDGLLPSGNALSPWYDGGAQTALNRIPITGDRVQRTAGHNISINGVFPVGDSPADDTGTPAILDLGAAGGWAFGSAAVVTFKGPVRFLCNPTYAQDCQIIHDSSGAAIPNNAHYSWQAPKHIVNGAPGHRVKFKKAVGSGNGGGFNGTGLPANDSNQIVGTSVEISDWGTGTIKLFRPNLVTAGSIWSLDADSRIDRCGDIHVYNCNNNCTFISDEYYRNPVGTSPTQLGADPVGNGFSNNPTLGTRRYRNYKDGCMFIYGFASDIGVDFGGVGNLQIIVTGSTTYPPMLGGGGAGKPKSANNVLLFNRQEAALSGGQDFGSESFVGPAAGLTNFALLRGGHHGHIIEGVRRGTWYDRWVAESELGNGGTGDVFQSETNNSGHYKAKLTHGLARYGPDGHSIGIVASHSFSTPINGSTVFGPQWNVEHNIFWTEDGGTGVSLGVGGETNDGFVGVHEHTRANLVLVRTPGIGYVCKWHDLHVPTLAAGTFADADWNGLVGITNFPYYRFGTNPSQYNGTPGSHDVTISDPQFVDDTASFLKWAQSKDGTITTWAQAIAKFAIMPDEAGYVAGFNVGDYISYMLDVNFVPQNTAVNVSYPGDPEQFLGTTAAPVVAPPPPSGNPRAPLISALTEYPVAPFSWAPDYSTTPALRALPHNGTWNDTRSPATLVRKLVGYQVEYPGGGPLISPAPKPSGKYNMVLVKQSTSHHVMLDYLPGLSVGAGASNERTFPNPQPIGGGLLCVSMSAVDNNTVYALCTDYKLRKYTISDVGITEVVSGHFPLDISGLADWVGIGVFPTWLRHDGQDRKFTFSSDTIDAVWCFDSQTGLVTTLTGATLRSDGSIPGGWGVNEAYIEFGGRYILVSLSPGDSVVWDTQTGSHTKLGNNWSHGQVLDGGVWASYVWARANPISDMSFSDEGRGYAQFVPVAANGQTPVGLTHTEANSIWNVNNEGDYEHCSTFWRQAGTAFPQRWVFGYQIPNFQWALDGSNNELPWAAYTGAIYRRPVGSFFTINAMVESDGTNHALRNMTKVGNLAALIAAGQWCLNGDGYAYAWRTDSAACTDDNVSPIRSGLTPGAVAMQQVGRSVAPRHICYTMVHPNSGAYNELSMANVGQDGTLVPFNTDLGLRGGTQYVAVAELPTIDLGGSGIPDHISIEIEAYGVIPGFLPVQPKISIRDIDGNLVTDYDGLCTAFIVFGNGNIDAGSTVEFSNGYAQFNMSVAGHGLLTLAYSVPDLPAIITTSDLNFPAQTSASRAHKRSR